MKEILLHTSDAQSRILVGESFRNLASWLPEKKLVIISDQNVEKHYGKDFPEGLKIIIPPGEESKTLKYAAGIYDQLIRNEIGRNSFILGIGGGIVTDLAGFIASTYLRGLSFGFVSTSLLGQVDASIGGKNGVNVEGYKNMVGIIRQPDFVLSDIEMLKTLKPEEFRMGFAEVIKYGAILDSGLFDLLEERSTDVLEMKMNILEEIIYICSKDKCRIVENDERESGERKKLNFGHTFAHAFEKLSGIPHGEAVSMGMVLAAGLSARLGMISEDELTRLRNLLEKYQLPLVYPHSCKKAFEVMKNDKKRDGDSIGLILLEGIGSAVVRDISLSELQKWMNDLC